MFWHFLAGVGVTGLLLAAVPHIAYQVVSDEGDGWSGAGPGCESHEEVWGECCNSLQPTPWHE